MGKTIDDYSDLVKEKHALNKTIAPVETNETDASRAYVVGEQLILSGILYDVIAAISEHDVITTTGSGANIAPAGPISSKIQTLTNEVDTIVNDLSAKNILDINLTELKALNTSGTWANNIYSANGLTFTVNENKTITVSGTATANTNLSLKNDINISGDYILSGCPVGGSQVDSEGYNIQARADGSWIGAKDSGDGLPITVNSIIERTLIHVANGTVMNNHVFKPMIRDASIKNSDYVPYAMTNRELTEKVIQMYVKNESYTYTVPSDTTWKQALHDFYVAANSYFYNLPAEDFIEAVSIGGTNLPESYPRYVVMSGHTLSDGQYMGWLEEHTATNDYSHTNYATISSDVSKCMYRKFRLRNDGNVVFTDETDNAVAANSTLTVKYRRFYSMKQA